MIVQPLKTHAMANVTGCSERRLKVQSLNCGDWLERRQITGVVDYIGNYLGVPRRESDRGDRGTPTINDCSRAGA